jgi:predicted glycoside hydrolase/deacetylase ChbG (UPF0249 family)
MKRIILCADDYGQNSAISQAIVELFKGNRLSATSCLVTSPDWPTHAQWLEPFKTTKEIGLHFNLTEGALLTGKATPLTQLILKANLHLITKADIINELNAQLDQFTTIFQQLPHYIDGHQHIHQLPVVRDALFEVYEQRLRQSGAYLRCTYNPNNLFRFQNVAYIKQLIIQLCGGFRFQSELKRRHIPHNQTFAGIYNFDQADQYAELFPLFLDHVSDTGMIMVHPGFSESENDAIAASRPTEYTYLNSPQFLLDCANKNIELVRFQDLYIQ